MDYRGATAPKNTFLPVTLAIQTECTTSYLNEGIQENCKREPTFQGKLQILYAPIPFTAYRCKIVDIIFVQIMINIRTYFIFIF